MPSGGKTTTKASEFLNNFAGIFPAIAQARDETTEYWAPEEPPITVAFAEIGHAFFNEIAVLEHNSSAGCIQDDRRGSYL